MSNRIIATEFNYSEWRWVYALEDKSVVMGGIDDARIPCGLEFTERNQWVANQLVKVSS